MKTKKTIFLLKSCVRWKIELETIVLGQKIDSRDICVSYRVFIVNLQFEGVKADILRFLTEYCRDDIDKNIAHYTKVIKVF